MSAGAIPVHTGGRGLFRIPLRASPVPAENSGFLLPSMNDLHMQLEPIDHCHLSAKALPKLCGEASLLIGRWHITGLSEMCELLQGCCNTIVCSLKVSLNSSLAINEFVVCERWGMHLPKCVAMPRERRTGHVLNLFASSCIHWLGNQWCEELDFPSDVNSANFFRLVMS